VSPRMNARNTRSFAGGNPDSTRALTAFGNGTGAHAPSDAPTSAVAVANTLRLDRRRHAKALSVPNLKPRNRLARLSPAILPNECLQQLALKEHGSTQTHQAVNPSRLVVRSYTSSL
jgi:hypothetical protein